MKFLIILLYLATYATASVAAIPEQLVSKFYNDNRSYFQKDHPEILSKMKRLYGATFTEKVIDLWMKDLVYEYDNDATCLKWIGTCDFYLCQEQKNKCGSFGYNLGYGYKYCSGSRFWLYNKMQSDLGRYWVVNVFQCLQKENLRVTDFYQKQQTPLSCDNIQKTSFLSHPDCYINSGFCELPLADQTHIMNLIKGALFSVETLTEGFKIIQKCYQRNYSL